MKRIIGYLTGFTAKFYLAAIVVLIAALPLSYCKGRSDGRALEQAKQARIDAQAVAQARKADEAGLTTAAEAKATSAVEIERGREAAKDAPDPWKAATEAMR